MQYRKFGNTDLLVSKIGFGAWAIGGGAMIGNTAIGWGDANDHESKKAIHRSLDLGINFFDTADIYGLGHSEQLIGELLGNKKDVIIATKVGNVSRNEQFTVDYSKEYILKACDESLKRLKRNVIDYYQLHSARLINLQEGECMQAMDMLQQQGKIRYWGISLNTFDPFPEADFFLKHKTGNGFQLVLNILNQKGLPVIKEAAKNGYGIIARMPLQFGLLTGKFDRGVSFSANDHRKNRLTAQVIETANSALESVWQLCKKYGVNKTELALSYILSYDEVSTVIPGIRTVAHAESNTTGLVRLEEEDRELIERFGTGNFVPVMEMIQKQG
jgi:aryl-alcohol dehydrogenase-like predicted oxidoreductase